MNETFPVNADEEQTAPKLVLQADVSMPDESQWIHKDYVKVVEPWAIEGHIMPPAAHERFGDIDSWAAYVALFGGTKSFVTWNGHGLRAVLDYHETEELPGRCQWVAEYAFALTEEWRAWTSLASGAAVDQRKVVQTLEERFNDVKEPDAARLLDIMRNLRGNVSSKAEVQLRPDGTSAVTFSRQDNVRGGSAGEIELPGEITISVPIIRGHTSEEGERVVYRFDVKVRASVAETGVLTFMFKILGAEAALEEVWADIVTVAKAALGDGFTVYRAAD